MNANYKFSRRLEMSCFNKGEVREYVMDHFRPEKKQMADEDLGTPATQANITFYTYAGVEMLKITTRDIKSKKLRPTGFINLLKGVVKKHKKLLLQEVREYEAWKKAKEKENQD